MNIETANHLVQLRKKNGFSQEALADKLGISRQAVSKWERAEASPDTDNLVELARLYNVSLDELLLLETAKEEPEQETAQAQGTAADADGDTDDGTAPGATEDSTFHVGEGGVHLSDESGRVDIDRNGVHITGKDGVCRTYTKPPKSVQKGFWKIFPFPVLVTAAYLALGFACDFWHPGWIMFFTIPLYYSLVDAIEKRNGSHFAFPVLMVIIYLILGFACGGWAWGWVIFLLVPVYYALPWKHHDDNDDIEGHWCENDDPRDDED